ncbi:O-acyltransferase WSD1, C-terminal [Dillenia turbinata]|uniref:O-acyltransferase WSD1, C-terminal n=1 Tax=Dillenia turbinata TaxID=194707 RepID=A0AAN8WCH8_9MAGN
MGYDVLGRDDEPLSPTGKLFLQQDFYEVINCVMGLETSIDVEAVKAELKESAMIKHPRFCSLLVGDKNGNEHWRKTQVDLDKHLIVLEDRVGEADDEEEVVNQYMADLAVSSPLATDKPLWEFHFLMAHKCGVLRFHHALGDGVSFMSLFLACCKKVGDPNQSPILRRFWFFESSKKSQGNSKAWNFLMVFLHIINFLLKVLWIRDPKTAISGGAGVELWPRKIAIAKLRLKDMKAVKRSVDGATINDVLFAIISSGLSRYLHYRTPKGVVRHDGRFSKSRWGNAIGVYLLPFQCNKSVATPLDYVKRAKESLDKKKLSLEAPFSHYVIGMTTHFFGSKVASNLYYRLISNTTFLVSNVAGPQEEISFAGHIIKFLRVNTSSLPHVSIQSQDNTWSDHGKGRTHTNTHPHTHTHTHTTNPENDLKTNEQLVGEWWMQALQVNMVSYAGRADLQIMVAKDIIPDPQFLAKCFEDSLLEMNDAATNLQS